MILADISDILAQDGGFDADWYARTHADVALTGLDPQAHFLRYGHRMGRGISADRPGGSGLGPLDAALSRKPDISYCIPVMNRPDDIRGTLGENLLANAPFRDRVEFILTFFDDDRKTHAWVRETFAAELAEGYLRLTVSDALDGWHFGKAKNAFRTTARGQVYSSLDGDNFVTAEETGQLLGLLAEHPDGFIFHHFTGNWGDGSSGRVSVSRRLFCQVGYDELLLPRQYDEIDLILSCMVRAPLLPLIRYGTDNHGLSSQRSTAFMRDAQILNPVFTVPPVHRHAPLNPRGAEYIARTRKLHIMQDFNQAQCFLKNAPNAALRKKYLAMTTTARQKLLDAAPAAELVDMLFEQARRPEDIDVASDAVCLFACVKNDAVWLEAFEAHYRSLGVTHFFIVDDGSKRPVRDLLPQDHVHVFRPKAGSFSTSKILWIEALMKAHLKPGAWALTVDADEFLDIPDRFADLPDLTAHLGRAGADYAPALLVDMLPGDDAPGAKDLEPAGFMDRFRTCLAMDGPPSAEYAGHHSVQWGFGDHAALSWAIDARWHAFGTFDSLRKIPLFRWRPGRHLNQGFHTLYHTDSTPQPGPEIWESDVRLALRHYKLARLFTDAGRTAQTEKLHGAHGARYHARTTQNITRIFSMPPQEALARLTALPRRPWTGADAGRFAPEPLPEVPAV